MHVCCFALGEIWNTTETPDYDSDLEIIYATDYPINSTESLNTTTSTEGTYTFYGLHNFRVMPLCLIALTTDVLVTRF